VRKNHTTHGAAENQAGSDDHATQGRRKSNRHVVRKPPSGFRRTLLGA